MGLTEFLNDENVKLEDIIHPSSFNKNLDVIYSGSIPPNPTDLLSNGKYEVLIENLKQQYDYIILDTAPLMLVTDSFLISEVADVTLYVTRSKYTEKTLIDFASKNIDAGKIKNVAFVLNDVDKDYFGYGNKYGYKVESWLLHHGEKLTGRFELSAYKLMNHLLKTIGENTTEKDLQDFAKISPTKIHQIAINSDYFFAPNENIKTHNLLSSITNNLSYHEINSIHGHDAFLIEYERLNNILKTIFNTKHTN
jgi:hypothetical protein